MSDAGATHFSAPIRATRPLGRGTLCARGGVSIADCGFRIVDCGLETRLRPDAFVACHPGTGWAAGRQNVQNEPNSESRSCQTNPISGSRTDPRVGCTNKANSRQAGRGPGVPPSLAFFGSVVQTNPIWLGLGRVPMGERCETNPIHRLPHRDGETDLAKQSQSTTLAGWDEARGKGRIVQNEPNLVGSNMQNEANSRRGRMGRSLGDGSRGGSYKQSQFPAGGMAATGFPRPSTLRLPALFENSLASNATGG